MNWTGIGAISALTGVAAGAFATHGLRSRLSEDMLRAFEVGVRYQMYHALALLAVGWLASQGRRGANVAGWCFLLGTVLFSGSLYLLSLTGARAFGPVTPMGGVLLLVGWCSTAWAAWHTSHAPTGPEI